MSERVDQTASFDAIVLLGFGGPMNSSEVRAFLDRVLNGRIIPPSRYEAVVAHYDAIGGASPYNHWTQLQADGLARILRKRGIGVPVHVAYRNAAPFVRDVVSDLSASGARNVFCVVLAPHQSAASWDKYVAGMEGARAELGSIAPAARYIEPYFDHPLFARAYAERLTDAMSRSGFNEHTSQVIFTAHSIPASVAGSNVYESQFRRSAELIAREARIARWTLAYQSRSGSPSEPWLGPDIRDVLRELPARGPSEAVVVPIGFLCDHVEVLYDLDIDAKAVAESAGVRFKRAQTLNDHPLFLRMLADLTIAGMRHVEPARR